MLLEADDHFSQAMATLGPGQHDSDGPGVRQQQAAGTSSDSDPPWQVKSLHHGNTLLARVQGCRTLLGPGPGTRTGPGRTPWADGRGGSPPPALHRNHPWRFHPQVADQRTDLAARTRTRPANPCPGAARQRTRDRAAPLDVPAASGMERPSQPTSTQRAHVSAPCHPNLAGCHTAP